MFYYVLPGIGIYGGIKKGFHCADLLTSSGHPCTVATPDGNRPTWFCTKASVITRNELLSKCTPHDTILFSYPPDASFVDSLPAQRKIVHMQGANTTRDRKLFRRDYEFISHGLHMTQQLLQHNRIAPYVPIGVPDVFRWRDEPKIKQSVVMMSRKGINFLKPIKDSLPPSVALQVIDGYSENEVAETLKRSDVFVAISTSEAFGLPPLEAMCAGCCVVGFPGDGGFEFMRHGETAHVVPNGDTKGLIKALQVVIANDHYRDRLRMRAIKFSEYYTLDREREYLLRAIGLLETHES